MEASVSPGLTVVVGSVTWIVSGKRRVLRGVAALNGWRSGTWGNYGPPRAKRAKEDS